MFAGNDFDGFLPIPLISGEKLEKSDLKYFSGNGSTGFYGFHKNGRNVVAAVQESSWYLAFLKPFYSRLRLFADESSQDTLAKLFSPEPTMRKLKKSMPEVVDLNDSKHANVDAYIKAFKKYYGNPD